MNPPLEVEVRHRHDHQLTKIVVRQGIQAVIWVVDTNDKVRIDEAAEELRKLLSMDELRVRTVFLSPIQTYPA